MPPVMPAVQLPMFDVVEIPMTKGYKAIVDPIDADLLQHKWHATTKQRWPVYAGRWFSDSQSIFMHRTILERILGRPLDKKETVDHVDGNGLNNRRSNLRLATASQNGANRKLTSRNSSGYKGVHWCKTHKQWKVVLSHYNTLHFYGYFDDLIEAARAYDAAALAHHGEFAKTNVMLGLLPPIDTAETK